MQLFRSSSHVSPANRIFQGDDRNRTGATFRSSATPQKPLRCRENVEWVKAWRAQFVGLRDTFIYAIQ